MNGYGVCVPRHSPRHRLSRAATLPHYSLLYRAVQLKHGNGFLCLFMTINYNTLRLFQLICYSSKAWTDLMINKRHVFVSAKYKFVYWRRQKWELYLYGHFLLGLQLCIFTMTVSFFKTFDLLWRKCVSKLKWSKQTLVMKCTIYSIWE